MGTGSKRTHRQDTIRRFRLFFTQQLNKAWTPTWWIQVWCWTASLQKLHFNAVNVSMHLSIRKWLQHQTSPLTAQTLSTKESCKKKNMNELLPFAENIKKGILAVNQIILWNEENCNSSHIYQNLFTKASYLKHSNRQLSTKSRILCPTSKL
jgi:hypothetical protein